MAGILGRDVGRTGVYRGPAACGAMPDMDDLIDDLVI
jgi:hypothetical protein